MRKPIGWSVNGVVYCNEHVPTTRLAELSKRPIHERLPGDRCHVCQVDLRHA